MNAITFIVHTSATYSLGSSLDGLECKVSTLVPPVAKALMHGSY